MAGRIFNDQNFLIEIDNLLHTASSEDLEKAIAMLTPVVVDDAEAYPYLAKAYVLARRPKLAIQAAESMVTARKTKLADFWIRWAYFWRATAHAQLQEREKALEFLAKAYAIDKDIQAQAISRLEFQPYFEDREFLSLLELPPCPKLDVDLQNFVKLINQSRYAEAFAYGMELHSRPHPDQASVVDGLLRVLEIIVEDIDEHGDANVAEFGRGKVTAGEFQNIYEKLKSQAPKVPSALKSALVWAAAN